MISLNLVQCERQTDSVYYVSVFFPKKKTRNLKSARTPNLNSSLKKIATRAQPISLLSMIGFPPLSSGKRKLGMTAAILCAAFLLVNFSSPNPPKPKMKVEIWSDVACPFCYIGKRKFEAALDNFAHADQIEVVWKSYLLNPALVTDTAKTYYGSLAEAKGWTLDYARQAGENVGRMAATAGLKYDMDRAIPANTLRAHRLLQAAKAAGIGSELKEQLLKAHFVDGRNIDDAEVLNQMGRAAGMSEAQITDGLTNAAHLDAVMRDVQEADSVGVTGVPFFVFDRKTAVSGAQDSGVFLKELERSFAAFAKPSGN